jgi:hypothetical protein
MLHHTNLAGCCLILSLYIRHLGESTHTHPHTLWNTKAPKQCTQAKSWLHTMVNNKQTFIACTTASGLLTEYAWLPLAWLAAAGLLAFQGPSFKHTQEQHAQCTHSHFKAYQKIKLNQTSIRYIQPTKRSADLVGYINGQVEMQTWQWKPQICMYLHLCPELHADKI